MGKKRRDVPEPPNWADWCFLAVCLAARLVGVVADALVDVANLFNFESQRIDERRKFVRDAGRQIESMTGEVAG